MSEHSKRNRLSRRDMLIGSSAGIGATILASLGSETTIARGDSSSIENPDEEIWEPGEGSIAHSIVKETDVAIPMRDGLDLATNVYRPEADGEYPVLMAFTAYGKDIYWGEGEETFDQEWPEEGVAYEAWSPPVAGTSTFEAENPQYWVPSGYVLIVVGPQGFARSPGTFNGYSS